MSYCSGCGYSLEGNTNSCKQCGRPVLAGQAGFPTPSPARPAQASQFVHPKRADYLALKAFGLACVLAIVVGSVVHHHKNLQSASMILAFGVGAAYIVWRQWKWAKHGDVIKGALIAWAVVGFLILMCLGALRV